MKTAHIAAQRGYEEGQVTKTITFATIARAEKAMQTDSMSLLSDEKV